MHADEGDNAAGDGAGVLDDDVAPALDVADLPHEERAAPGVRGHRAEHVDDVLRHALLLRPVGRRVVLQVRGLADQLGEEADEAVAVEAAHGVLKRRRCRGCHLRRERIGRPAAAAAVATEWRSESTRARTWLLEAKKIYGWRSLVLCTFFFVQVDSSIFFIINQRIETVIFYTNLYF